MTELLFILFAGLCFGSFITCASYRLPLGIDVVKKPSYCPSCNHKLGFRDLFPVFSWLSSGGKCRHCKSKISIRYPLIELATALLFALVYVKFGFTLLGAVLMLMTVMLMILIVADLEHYIIPDTVHVVLLPLGALYHYLKMTAYEDPLYGFLFGAGLGLFLHYVYSWIRGRTMLGFGDVKFLGVMGLWLGLYPLIPALVISGVFGVVFGLIWRVITKNPVFPFGPSLAASLFVGVVYPEIYRLFWTLGGLLG